MPDHPPPQAPARIAFLGFSDFERAALATCFRLAAERETRFQPVVTLTDADYLVADADHGPSVQLVVVTERLAETVFIGSSAPDGAAAVLRRPIDALRVMKALDALAVARGDAVPQVAPPPRRSAPWADTTQSTALAPELGVIVESMLRMPPPSVQPASPTTPVVTDVVQPAAPAARRSSSRRAAASPPFIGPPAPLRALLVDDSDIARRYLSIRLSPWGVRTDTARTSAEAVDRLAQASYRLIFLDVELGPDSELDGLALCRHIKRSALAIDATVVMVSAHHAEVDRARGALAGCDGYIGKPVKDAELATLLRRQGLLPPEAPSAGSVASAPAPRAATAAPTKASPA